MKMIEGLILAAGLSSRMGSFKMSLDIMGKSVLERCIEGMYGYCQRIIVIGGHNIGIVAEIVKKCQKVDLINNINYQDGMLSSVKTGFKQLKGERFFFTPGDYPMISSNTYISLLNMDGNIIIPTYKGIKGHPILMKSNLASKFLETTKYYNLRDFINDNDYVSVEVEDEWILRDVDTLEDYNAILRKVDDVDDKYRSRGDKFR